MLGNYLAKDGNIRKQSDQQSNTKKSQKKSNMADSEFKQKEKLLCQIARGAEKMMPIPTTCKIFGCTGYNHVGTFSSTCTVKLA